MLGSLTNLPPDFSAQFRPRYAWNDDVMRAAWWWAMWWPWVSLGMKSGFSLPRPTGIAALFEDSAGGA